MKLRFWLSRERFGLYMMTYFRPTKSRIGSTETEEFYVPPGDPIGIRHWCPAGVKMFFGVDIPIGEQTQIELELPAGKIIDEPSSQPHQKSGSKKR